MTCNLVYIALTRASQRVWLFIEDLRKEVLATQQLAGDFGVTSVGEWRTWALQGILTDAQIRAIRQNADERLSRSRSQMPWARLLHNTVHIWGGSFTDAHAQTHIPPAVYYFCGDLVSSNSARFLCSQRWVNKNSGSICAERLGAAKLCTAACHTMVSYVGLSCGAEHCADRSQLWEKNAERAAYL